VTANSYNSWSERNDVSTAAPYWRQNKVPTDVEVIEDDPAEIDCLADGSPRPTIEWYINGVPIHGKCM